MEPEQNESVQESSKLNNLRQATPFSKYLAMLLFVALPFIGGWIGYNLAIKEMAVETITSKYLTASPANGPNSLKVRFQNLYKYPDTYLGGKSLSIHFGDGQNTLIKDVALHKYTDSGIYEVKLMGCSLNIDLLCKQVELDSLKIEITPGKVAEVKTSNQTKPKALEDSSEPEIATSTILSLLFGNSDSTWSIPAETRAKLSENYYNDSTLPKIWSVKVIATSALDNSLFVITKATHQDYTAHVYGAIIGMHVLTKSDSNWIITSTEPAKVVMGSFGDFPDSEVSVLPLSESITGFLFQPTYTGQGYTEEKSIIYAYTGLSFNEVLTLDTQLKDNMRTLDKERYSRVTNIDTSPQTKKGSWFDIYTTTVTTTDKNGETSTDTSKRKYRFDGTKYIEIDVNE